LRSETGASGVSIALALTFPSGDVQVLLLTATYVVVVFSVAVQGTPVGVAARRLLRPAGLTAIS
jgi:monovalent cation:H+ antiporter, CPA1 family